MVLRIGFDPGHSVETARCAGAGSGCSPQSSVQVNGNTIETPRYRIELNNNRDDHAVTVIDKLTGGSKKAYFGGDPHASTSDGDWTTWQHGNLTLNLDDGTKLTFDPTDNPTGPTYLKHVTVTNGDDAAVVNFGADGNPTAEARPGEGHRLDRRTPDGLELRTMNGSLDDLRVVGGPEIVGRNIADLDDYRAGQNAFFNRPSIGLPGWGHEGPHGPWDSGRHDHHRHHNDRCEPNDHGGPRAGGPHASGPHGHHGGGHHASEIRNLQAQLRFYLHQASHGSWSARIGAHHHIAQIERRLNHLRA